MQIFYFGLTFKNMPHRCADTAPEIYSARAQFKRMRFSTKNLARRETGWYLTVVQMEWLIAQRREESFTSHAVTDREDHPGTVPWVCDGLMQMQYMAMKHSI